MDAKFHPAIAAIQNGDLDGLVVLLTNDPSLATARSSVSHPTLLQFLVLQAIEIDAARRTTLMTIVDEPNTAIL